MARRLGVHRQSATRWRKEWLAWGKEALASKGRLGRKRELTEDQEAELAVMRVLMQRAAREAGTPVGEMSFKESLDLATSIHESFRDLSGKPRKMASQMAFLIEMLSRRTIDARLGRREPRAIKKRPRPFPLLTAPRHEFIEIPHRSNHRACA